MNSGKNLFTIILIALLLISANGLTSKGTKKFTFQDVMKFEDITNAVISDDGLWVAYSASPQRGDGYGIVKSVGDTMKYLVERGKSPRISTDSKWAAFIVKAKAMDLLKAKSPKDKPKSSMTIVNMTNGEQKNIEKVKQFEFSTSSEWLAYNLYKDDGSAEKEKDKYKKKQIGSKLLLRHMETGTEIAVEDVTEFHIDTTSTFIFYTVSSENGKRDGIYYRELKKPYCPESQLMTEENHSFSNLTWNKDKQIIAFLKAGLRESGEPYKGSLWTWDPSTKMLNSVLPASMVKEGWYIPVKNKLQWTRDGERLFFGIKPNAERHDDDDDDKTKITEDNFYNIDTILQDTELDIWHWNDPLINSNQKKEWNSVKDQTYKAVYHLDSNIVIPLADSSMPEVSISENPDYAVAYNGRPYKKEITWSGWYHDMYLVNLKTGEKKLIAKHLEEQGYLSPLGKYLVYFSNKNWLLYDIKKDSTRILNERVDLPFYNEVDDIPKEPGSYGVAGWFEDDASVLINDRYDIWRFNTTDNGFFNITAGDGRANKATFRILKMDPDKVYYTLKDSIFLYGFHNKKKFRGLFMHETWILGSVKLYQENDRFTFLKKAKAANRMLYTIEKYDKYPDIMVADPFFTYPMKVSDLNKQIEPFNYGQAELVEWKNSRGEDLQGYILKPYDYDPNKKYPVLIYFYDKFSDRFNSFITPRINHRPCYPVYISDGYVMFMPDIKYKDGRPGFDATDALVTGAQKLIDIGIADSNAIGIQGHSWGGYETAFIVTQTNMFKAAVAGAPVGNMTSAYSGIRLGTGLARQFQYEKYQSRIGGHLWDSLDAYINNSPVFKANKVVTPLLIMFGDVDEAVPWQQGIELYLAMRRLDKNCIFLQYRNEPHHPKKLHNQLDYAIKMKEYFDHYLKGKPAPEWMTKGVPYIGK